MESQPLYTLSINQAKSLIKDCIKECLEEKNSENTKIDLPKYYHRKEVAEVLGLSLPTLDRYSKLGLIKSRRIGNRVLFSEEDIQRALNEGPVKYARISGSSE